MHRYPYLNKPVIYFIATLSILTFSIAFTSSIYPYYVLSLKIDMTTYGLVNTMSSIINIFLRIPFSTLFPRIGYFKSYCISYILLILSRFFYIASIFLYPLIMFMFARIFMDMRYAMISTARTAIVTKYVESKNRAFTLGFISSVTIVFSSISPFIGSYLYEKLDYNFQQLFSISILISLIAIIPLIILVRKYEIIERKEKSLGIIFQIKMIPKIIVYKDFKKIFFISMIDGFAWSISGNFFQIYLAKELSVKPSELAILNLIENIIAIFGLTYIGHISDRLRKRVIFLFISEVLGIFSLLFFIMATNVFQIFFIWILQAFVWIMWSPIISAYISEKAEKFSQKFVPLTLGVWGFLNNVARTPGNVIGGYLYDTNPRYPFIFTVILLLIISIMILRLKD